MKKSKKTAFAAILCALGIVIMYVGSIIDLLDITMACMASFLIVVSVLELGASYPLLIYFCTSVLSFLILPNKSVCLIYILFFGFYPMLKRILERMRMIFSWICKIALFNVMLIAYYFLAEKLFFIKIEESKIVMTVLLNVIFVTFDLVLTMFVSFYVYKIRKRLRLDKLFK